MNTEERLAQINEVSQRILNMPEAERQAYINQYGDAINEMLNEYKELKRPRQSMAKDPITERTPEQQAALSGDQPTQEAPRQRRRRRQDRRQDTPETETPTEENVGPVIVRTNTDGTVSDAAGNNYIVDNKGNIIGSAAGSGSQTDTTGTGSNVVTPKGSSDNSGADAPMWPLYGLLGLGIGGAYGAIKGINAKNKPKIIPPGANIPGLGEVREGKLVSEGLLSDGKVIQQGPKGYLSDNSKAIKPVSEGLLSDGKVIVQGPKGYLPDKRNTSISQIMSRPGIYEPVEGYHTPADIASKSKNRISQIMSRPGNFEPLEGYHTPVKTAVENAAEKGVKNAVKKGAKNAILDAIEKGAKKALPKFIQKAIF